MNFIKKISRINPIEILIALAVVVFFVVLKKNLGSNHDQWKTIRVQVINQSWPQGLPTKPPIWLYNMVKTGDVEKDNSGKTVAEVREVESFEDYEAYIIPTYKAINNVNGTLNLYFTIRIKTNGGLYKNFEVKEGSNINFTFNKANIVGQIVDDDVPETGYEKKTLMVSGRLVGASQETISKLKKGDRMLNLSNNETAAELVDFTLVPKTNYNPNLMPVLDLNSSNDAKVKLKINAEKIGNNWFFAGGQKIKSPYAVFLSFSSYDLYPVIVDDFEIQ